MLSPRCVLLLLLVTCLSGCGGEPSSGPSTGKDGPDGASGVETVSAEGHDPTASDASEQPDPTETPASDDRAEGGDDSDQGRVDDVATDTGPSLAPESRERFLLLVSGGPLIIDLVLSVEGEPHDAALKRFVDEELAASDVNRDGQTTWKEIANSTRYQYGQFRYNPVPQMRMYDGNGDGLVHPGELLRFLTGNVGSTQSFVLRRSNRSRYHSKSTVLELLDGDADGAVAPEEMKEATTRLVSFDADDNEVLRFADFKTDYVRPSLMMSSQRPDQAEMAIRINERTDWSYTWYSLAELYGDGTRLNTEDFSLLAAEVKTLDADQDGTVSTKEVKGLREMPPHLVVKASFGELRKSGGTPRTRLQMESLSECL
ncbi:MAG: hypothetical protein H8E44_31995, partial [Planctomycetes bacterium]|nr:hypothetical protein [Planctomycetota bacterium]